MPAWVATSRAAVDKGDDLSMTVHEGDRRSSKVKAQMDAAEEAAAQVIDASFDGPVNVTISGFAQGKDETGQDEVRIYVAKVDG